MPSDTYILTISDTGVSIPSSHGSTHISGGGDTIPNATTTDSGLMSAAVYNQHVSNTTKISSITGNIVGTTDSQTITNKTFGSGNTFSTAIPVSSGGTGKSTFGAGILKANGTTDFTTVAAPQGTIVGTFDSQTLTNKTFGSGNTFSSAITVSNGGTGQSSFSAGILRTTGGTSNFTTISEPQGTIVGTTDAQTLTNKTFGNNTALGVPVSGNLVNCTGLPLSTGLTGTLPVANGGSGATTFSAGLLRTTGGTSAFSTIPLPAGDVVGTTASQTLTNKTLTAPVLGTPTSGTLTNCTGLPLDAGTTGNIPASRVTGIATVPAAGVVTSNGTTFSSVSTLPVASGGTGQTSVVRGQVYGGSSHTVTVAASNTFYPISVSGTLNSTVSTNMSIGAASTFSIKNTSGTTRIFRVYAQVMLDTGVTTRLAIKLYSGIAGSLTAIDESEVYLFHEGNPQYETATTSCLISLANSEEVAIYVCNVDEIEDIAANKSLLVAEAVL